MNNQPQRNLGHAGFPTASWWAAFSCILLLAALLRTVNLNGDEVRTDEGNYALRAIGWNDFMFSTSLGTPWVWMMDQTVLPKWTLLSFNDHPPLHFAAIWLSTRLLGLSLWAVRLPSVLYGLGTIALVMFQLRRWEKTRGSLMAGTLLALLPWHIFISRQAIQESGVMFFLTATVVLCDLVDSSQSASTPGNWLRWTALGGTIGLGLLTKYSAIYALLPLAYLTWYRRWYQHPGFWLLPLTIGTLLSGVFFYNRQLLLLRGHFDLQLSRLFTQDTKLDWPASHQDLWQGDPTQFAAFLKHQWIGLSLPAGLLLVIGAAAMVARRSRRQRPSITAMWTGLLGSLVLTAVTLNDYGRSSILLPWYALTFGITLEALPDLARRYGPAAVLGLLALANVPRLAATPELQRLVKTFPAEPNGFAQWESWRADHVPTKFTPRHYQSLADWLNALLQRSSDHPNDVIVYDNRITWFASNWYFFRYGFYAQDAAFMNAGIFAVLADQNALDHLRGRQLRFVEVGPAALDSKGAWDDQTVRTSKFFSTLRARQRPVPTVISSPNGDPLLTIWPLRWDEDVNFPLAPPRALPNRP